MEMANWEEGSGKKKRTKGRPKAIPLLFRWREAIQQSILPHTTRLILFDLSLHMETDGTKCFPSTERLARETGLSKKTICTRLGEKETKRWVRIEVRVKPGQAWRHHQYYPLLPKGGVVATPPSEGKVGKLAQKGGEAASL